MVNKYYKEFHAEKYLFNKVKEICGNISEAILHIETNSAHKLELLLINPKFPSAPSSTNRRDYFEILTTISVKSFKVFGEQSNAGVLWRIEIWDNCGIAGNTIHCKDIQGLPEDGWIVSP